MPRFFLFLHFIFVIQFLGISDTIPEIKRKLPPVGNVLPEEDLKKLNTRLEKIRNDLSPFQEHPNFPDIHIFVKSIDFLLEHRELYRKEKLSDLLMFLKNAEKRVKDIKQNKTPWTTQKGIFVRGFASDIDQSIQPYGLEISEKINLNKENPLVIWLHGRGDTKTDYYFLKERLHRPGKFQFDNAIILHPFGRQCIGYKHVGEADILEIIEHIKTQYKIDDNRIALMGFSMGGAGSYHLGAHFADQFCAIHTGAGFVETAKYNKLTPETYPPKIEQTLWRMYDVPNYTRNFHNTPILAYCGELDSKIPWVNLMQESFRQHDLELPTLVGKKMGHKYHPDDQVKIQNFISDAIKKGKNNSPKEVRLQTSTLQYSKNYWITATGLKEHWKDSRIDASVINDHTIKCHTLNIRHFKITSPWKTRSSFKKNDKIVLDGQTISIQTSKKVIHLIRRSNKWATFSGSTNLEKVPHLQGPMDDAYMSKFIVVTPDKKTKNPSLQHWLDFEIERLRKRWKALYRGTLPECKASELTQEQIDSSNLILWGTPETNKWISKTIDSTPLKWSIDLIKMGSQEVTTKHHVPNLIYPNPLNQAKYILYNTAPTFREGHDRTNSLQNPKLGDWAILDIRQNPDQYSAGKVVATDFFDEFWVIK